MNLRGRQDTLLHILVLLLGLGLAVQPSFLLAAESPSTAGKAPAAKVSDAAQTGQTVQHSLAYFLGGRAEATLRYTDTHLDIPVPLGYGQKVVGANLQLRVTPSAALNAQSWMVVLVNGQVAGQFSLAGNQGPTEQTLSLPGTLFQPGFNIVELRAAQHYASHCEYPMAGQIWSQVQLKDSSLTLKLAPTAWQPNLSDLGQIFDPAQTTADGHLRLFYTDDNNPGYWEATVLAVEGAALRYQYLPLDVRAQSFSAEHLQAWLQEPATTMQTALFVGNPTTLEPLLRSAQERVGTNLPALRILRWPGHPHHVGVALVGQGKPLVELAHAFADPAVLWPPLTQASVHDVRFPPSKNLLPPKRVAEFSDDAFALADLGFTTQTRTGYDPASFDLRLWNGGWQRKAQLRLHLAYAAGMSPQSALNVVVNGSALDSIPLNNPQGGRYSDYTVTLPPTILHPGWNAIHLEPVLVPQSNGGDCRPFFLGNLWVTVYGDSVFQWMGGGLRARQPDLAPLAEAAYPFNGQGRHLTVQGSSLNAANISAAMTLLGKLVQAAGHPLPAQFVAQSKPLPTADIYVGTLQGEGAWDQIPGGRDALFQEEPEVGSVHPEHSLLALMQEPVSAPRAHAHIHWDAEENGDLAFLRIWRTGDKTRVLLTARDLQKLQQATQTLVQYGPWAQLKGNLAWWRVGSDRIFTLGMSETPFRTFGVRGGLALWVSRHPWISLAVLLFFGLLFVLASRSALRQYAQRRQRAEMAEAEPLAAENVRSLQTPPPAAAPSEQILAIPVAEPLADVHGGTAPTSTAVLLYQQNFRIRTASGGWHAAVDDPRYRRMYPRHRAEARGAAPYPYWI
ncbi:cellulose biosynthesis cyclic di-GMP-binding regulatory protein BcsB [Acidithiobacillus caldus]|uniref:cellulose biosynthesis cyclic di-GMP-binding regulatory protein BcsB n=1 Tax=Acidithiobacillus caldus TaxID=33059 RepID=UPI001C076C21|nr:cellulose biosynthesis cyclic di-GMP-binding regulatory protein BcsB [Acidithiobacillus caldus]MBU2821321.1 cellulose biosynthesis cyclic di-GMP-binding regulatory protein BcsB [Acidithiobacillus caldus]